MPVNPQSTSRKPTGYRTSTSSQRTGVTTTGQKTQTTSTTGVVAILQNILGTIARYFARASQRYGVATTYQPSKPATTPSSQPKTTSGVYTSLVSSPYSPLSLLGGTYSPVRPFFTSTYSPLTSITRTVPKTQEETVKKPKTPTLPKITTIEKQRSPQQKSTTPATILPEVPKVSVEGTKSVVTSVTPPPTPKEPSLTDEGLKLLTQSLGYQSNVPEGTSTYVVKDPLGGSTPVFDYVVQPGDTLSKIAAQFGTTVEELKRLNKENKRAYKGGDLIIAGETLHIPVKVQAPTKPEVSLKDVPPTVEDINRLQQQATEPPFIQTFFTNLQKAYQEELSAIERIYNQYLQFQDPTFYQRKYEELVKQLGLDETQQRIFELQKIMSRTRQDLLEEAAAVGGFVTQSQLEEVLAWRNSLLKGELEALIELEDYKQKIIEKTMKYIEMDRKQLENILDAQLDLHKLRLQTIEKFMKTGYDYYKDMVARNTKRLDFLWKTGAIAEMSDEYLLQFANPDSMLYAEYTPEMVLGLKQAALEEQQRKQLKSELDELRMQLMKAQIEQKELQIQKLLTKINERTTGDGKTITDEMIVAYRLPVDWRGKTFLDIVSLLEGPRGLNYAAQYAALSGYTNLTLEQLEEFRKFLVNTMQVLAKGQVEGKKAIEGAIIPVPVGLEAIAKGKKVSRPGETSETWFQKLKKGIISLITGTSPEQRPSP